jgi:NhaA family Na+:H+ antiporter
MLQQHAARVARESAARLARAFQEFVALEAAGGILLLAATAAALVWANSPWAGSYHALWATPVTVGVGGFAIAKPLELWVNDGLMAVFFFVVGLEIKRELLVGELASPKRAALPAIAALGGMVVPAAIYLAFNLDGPGSRGWGVPMATDIAFAIGVLALLGDRVPLSLKVFLTALAIVDDLGAVLVIALFYTAHLSGTALAVGGGIYLVMLLANRLRVRNAGVYAVLGVALWVALLKSGVHATIAGVLAATMIPSRARINIGQFRSRSRSLLDRFEELDADPAEHRLSGEQQEVAYGLAAVVHHVETPLQRLEHALHPWVSFVIMPVFALANAGLLLRGDLTGVLVHPVTIGVTVGLVLGKLVGVAGFTWIAVGTGVAERPQGATWGQILGVAQLAGIGFTMSLFIAALAFGQSPLLDNAKMGILGASLVSGAIGAVLLAGAGSRERDATVA